MPPQGEQGSQPALDGEIREQREFIEAWQRIFEREDCFSVDGGKRSQVITCPQPAGPDVTHCIRNIGREPDPPDPWPGMYLVNLLAELIPEQQVGEVDARRAAEAVISPG